MREFLAIAGAAALAILSTAAHADDAKPAAAAAAFTPKSGQMVVSSDNKRVGRIDRVEATRVGVILDSQYVYIPTASLSAGENGRVVTSLARRDIGR
ncbi:MAG TPA: hypothetical protein VI199_03975 [Novosphingobium sp.]